MTAGDARLGGRAHPWFIQSHCPPASPCSTRSTAARPACPVIFLHGVSDSWRSFEHVLPLLPPTIRALAITARGHGDSSRPSSGYRTRTWPRTSARS